MFALLRWPQTLLPADVPAPGARRVATGVQAGALVSGLACLASSLGREAAEVRGAIDEAHHASGLQAQAVQSLVGLVAEVVQAQATIGSDTAASLRSVAAVGSAVDAVGAEVAAIEQSLRQVAGAAAEITQIASQTRLLASNAAAEAGRDGEGGSGSGVVASAVMGLAGQVEVCSRQIMGTVAQLEARMAALAREIGSGRNPQDAGVLAAAGEGGLVDRASAALAALAQGVHRIEQASAGSRGICAGLGGQVAILQSQMGSSRNALSASLERTGALSAISEQMIDQAASGGVETEDTPYIRAAQQMANRIGCLLDAALREQQITLADIYHEQHHLQPGNPAQHETRLAALADRLFPAALEPALQLSDKVVFCMAVDRNGHVACHNRPSNQAQRAADPVWNAAHCRNRPVFNDSTGLASARSQRPFLLQIYRHDLGGGQSVVLKEAAAPIVAGGRHWGGLRLAFTF